MRASQPGGSLHVCEFVPWYRVRIRVLFLFSIAWSRGYLWLRIRGTVCEFVSCFYFRVHLLLVDNLGCRYKPDTFGAKGGTDLSVRM